MELGLRSQRHFCVAFVGLCMPVSVFGPYVCVHFHTSWGGSFGWQSMTFISPPLLKYLMSSRKCLLPFLLSSSPPFTGPTLAHSVSLSRRFFFPLLSSLCLLCFRSATLWSVGKAFYIPHITDQLQSIVFMSA